MVIRSRRPTFDSLVGKSPVSMANKMWFGFQFNLSDSSDDDLYRLDLDPEGQGYQWKMISIQQRSYFGAPQKKNRAGGTLG